MFICVDCSSVSFCPTCLVALHACLLILHAFDIGCFQQQHADVKSDIGYPDLHLCGGQVDVFFIHFHRSYKCLYMRRGEKPEGHRQMRPKTFPASNSGNSQQMLQEIRNSLRNLTKPSDPPKVDSVGQAKMLPEDPRQQGRTSTPKHHKVLQEIRKSLVPFEVNVSQSNDSTASGPDLSKQMLLEPSVAGFEEVRYPSQMHNLIKICELFILFIPL